MREAWNHLLLALCECGIAGKSLILWVANGLRSSAALSLDLVPVAEDRLAENIAELIAQQGDEGEGLAADHIENAVLKLLQELGSQTDRTIRKIDYGIARASTVHEKLDLLAASQTQHNSTSTCNHRALDTKIEISQEGVIKSLTLEIGKLKGEFQQAELAEKMDQLHVLIASLPVRENSTPRDHNTEVREAYALDALRSFIAEREHWDHMDCQESCSPENPMCDTMQLHRILNKLETAHQPKVRSDRPDRLQRSERVYYENWKKWNDQH